MRSDHIRIQQTSSGTDVLVDDCELFDYVDDVLTAAGLESEYSVEEKRDGVQCFVLHFDSGIPEARLRAALDGISEADVERIWRLNN